MATFFYFTNPDFVKPQTEKQAFGPRQIGDQDSDIVFNLTSKHLAWSNLIAPEGGPPPAVAVTGGEICVVESKYRDLSNKPYYNIILKPNLDENVVFPQVKYFIYRMVKYDSLFLDRVGTNAGKVIPNSNLNSNDLTRMLWREFNSLLPVYQTPEFEPDEHHLGTSRLAYLRSKLPDPTDPIYLDDLFYTFIPQFTTSSTTPPVDTFVPASIPLPLVNAGDSMGHFKTQEDCRDLTNNGVLEFKEFGFDILLDVPGFNPTIEEIFKEEFINDDFFHKITIPVSLNTTFIRYDARKMQCLNYMDPAAFYGNIASQGGHEVSIKRPVVRTYSSVEDIYKRVLVGTTPLSTPEGNDRSDAAGKVNLYNRNRVYLDIRDRFNFPYNFYREKNFTDPTSDIIPNNNLALSFNENPLVPIDYNYYQFLELKDGSEQPAIRYRWPILILNYKTGVEVDYNTSNSDDNALIQSLGFPEAEANNKINIAFPIFDELNKECFSYVHKQNDPPDSINRAGIDTDIFVRERVVPGQFFGNKREIVCASVENKPVASLLRVNYIEYVKEVIGAEWDNTPTENPPLSYPIPLYDRKTSYLDFLFPVEMKNKWKGFVDAAGNDRRISSSVSYQPCYIDNASVSGRDFMGYIGIARDQRDDSLSDRGKVTLFAFDSQPERRYDTTSMRFIDTDPLPAGATPENRLIPIEFSLDEFLADPSTDRFYAELSNRLKSIGFGRFMIIPSNPSNPDAGTPLFADRLLNVSTYNANDEFDQKDERGLRTTEDFVAMGIPKADYDQLLSDYKTQFLDDSDYIDGTPVYFGFKPVDSGKAGLLEWIKFEITLDGFKSVGGDTELIRWDSGIFIYEFIDTINLNNYLVPNLEPDSRGFGLRFISDTSGNPTTQQIVSKVHLAKSPDISYDEFIRFANYYRSNIRHVYNTTSNKGLTAAARINNSNSAIGNLPITNTNAEYPVNNSTEYYQQVNPINADGVEVLHASPIQFKYLGENEIIIMVQRNQPAERSAMTRYGNGGTIRRQGVIHFISPAPADATPYRDGNTAAHEFGHLLSLADRYSAIARIHPTVSDDVDDTFNAGSHILLLTETYDKDYTNDYRWLNNLMSLAYNVPMNADTAAEFSSPQSALVITDYRLRMAEFESTSNDQNVYGNVFITPQQWQHIYDEACLPTQPAFEGLNPAFSKRETTYFIPPGAPFDPLAYVGYDFDAAPNFLRSDNNFAEASPIDRLNNHKMSQRQVVNALAGYFDPYLDIDPIRDNFLRGVEQSQDNLFYLIVGRTYANLLRDHDAVINSVGAGAPSNIVNVPLSNSDIMTRHQDFNAPTSGYGGGDAVGNAVWNHTEAASFAFENFAAGNYQILVNNRLGVQVVLNFTWTIEYTNRLFILRNV